MASRQLPFNFFLLVALAFLGVVLIAAPAWLAAQIDTVSRLGKGWLYAYLAAVGIGGLLFLGSAGWLLGQLWRRTRARRQRKEQRARNPSEMSAADVEREFEENLAAVDDLQRELAAQDRLRRELEPLLARLQEKRESRKLEIVAFGAISSGKSSLLNALAGRELFLTDAKGGTTIQRNEIPWPGQDHVWLVDTPGLAEVDGEDRGRISAESAQDADLVLMVVDGPLRQWEVQLLRVLAEMEKRVIICLNKSDWYGPDERQALLGQIREQVGELVESDDMVAVRSQATRRPRRRVYADGSEIEEMVDVPADISPVAERMLAVIQRDGRELLLANLLLQSRGLVEDARRHVREALDRRAWETVEVYTWGAGSAAALSPWPVLDLAAGAAVSTKMVVDLGHIYRQEIDLQTAVRLMSQLGKQLLSILGVSAATPAVASAVASLLKTVPGAGTLAGGVLQGVVQAVITRWIGGVFIAYFRNEMQEPEGGLAAVARREWQRLTTLDELRRLVQAARSKMSMREEKAGKAGA